MRIPCWLKFRRHVWREQAKEYWTLRECDCGAYRLIPYPKEHWYEIEREMEALGDD